MLLPPDEGTAVVSAAPSGSSVGPAEGVEVKPSSTSLIVTGTRDIEGEAVSPNSATKEGVWVIPVPTPFDDVGIRVTDGVNVAPDSTSIIRVGT